MKMETLATTWVTQSDWVRNSVVTFKFVFPSRGSTGFNLEIDSERNQIFFSDSGGMFGKFSIPTLLKRVRGDIEWGLENL